MPHLETAVMHIITLATLLLNIFQSQKLDITMLYSSTITDTADEVLGTKKTSHPVYTVAWQPNLSVLHQLTVYS